MSDTNVINFIDEKLRILGIQHSFTPHSQGYPAYRDPAADNPVGILSEQPTAAETRHWKNHYAPNEPR